MLTRLFYLQTPLPTIPYYFAGLQVKPGLLPPPAAIPSSFNSNGVGGVSSNGSSSSIAYGRSTEQLMTYVQNDDEEDI